MSAPHPPHLPLRTCHPPVASATDVADTGEGTAADGDDITALATQLLHPSHVLPLSGHMQDRIKWGKYTNFDKLLLPTLTPPLFMTGQKSTKQRKTEKRQVTDLTLWLEAWNRYATLQNRLGLSDGTRVGQVPNSGVFAFCMISGSLSK